MSATPSTVAPPSQPAHLDLPAARSEEVHLEFDAFIRSIGISARASHAFLIGAGASVTSGIPPAEACIWEWKRRIFTTNNSGLERQFQDVSLPAIRLRIQRWLDGQGEYPQLGSSDEYGFYAGRCFPIPEDRRRFFEDMVRGARPHVGYRLLALLARSGLARSVWNINFDGLCAAAMTSLGATVLEIGLDTADRIDRPLAKDEVRCIALHGDYRYDYLKNTDQELKDQDERLRSRLIEEMRETSFIVCGYSGRDESVMNALREAVQTPGSGRLYWCAFGADVLPDVVELVGLARSKGREAFIVQTPGFDETMARLARECLPDAREEVEDVLCELKTSRGRTPFGLDATAITSAARSNAFRITCPSEVFQFELKDLAEHAWSQLREMTKDVLVVAVPYRGKVFALGLLDDLKRIFGPRMNGSITRVPLTENDLIDPEGPMVSLLRSAIVKALAAKAGLDSNGQGLIWDASKRRKVMIGEQNCCVDDAVLVTLRSHGGSQSLLLKPTLHVTSDNGQRVERLVDQEAKRQLLSKQYNNKFADAVDAWNRRLLGAGGSFEFPPNVQSTFSFNISPVSTYALIASQAEKGKTVPPAVFEKPHLLGKNFPEPKLVFADLSGSSTARDSHPIRGLLANRPFDFPITQAGLAKSVSLGIVCPANHSRPLLAFLSQLHQKAHPTYNVEYLLPFPGFAQAFGLPLDIPSFDEGLWAEVPELNSSLSVKEGALDLRQRITRAIDALEAKSTPSVILIFIPKSWTAWEKYEFEGEAFDLHDFVKAYSAQKGISTQFLREETLADPNPAQVLWWLSLSFYVKSMRTPWVLDCLEPDTAFLGLGFTIDRSAERGKHVVVGCSHIYSADGRGLQYRLSKVEDPIWRGRNAFMSEDDARRMGDTVRQLFHESNFRLPGRVVAHKRTPFLPEEIRGLLKGLEGVDRVDLLEITEDPTFRFTACRSGSLDADGFPLRRGTTILMDDYRALVWIHGIVDALRPNRRFFLGGRRIPAPVIVTRHHGETPLGTIVQEMLGLSKMNWNTFDMYSKLPATIDSSNRIARIGKLLDRFGNNSFDYRLFI